MFSVTDYIIRWESGDLEFDEEVRLFQHLIDTGMVYQLQGFYGRHAQMMLDEGYLTLPKQEEPAEAKLAAIKRGSSRRGRPTTKRVGAMVSMAQRRHKGAGIIIDRIENLNILTAKELRQSIIKMREEGVVTHVNEHVSSSLEKFAAHNHYILVHWFTKPSEYDIDESYYERCWYPDKWVKVISPAPTQSSKK